MNIRVGDIVGRKSYGYDVIFKVHDILVNKDGSRTVILKGLSYRLLADAPEADLVLLPANRVKDELASLGERTGKLIKGTGKGKKGGRGVLKKLFPSRAGNEIFKIPGKVLHIDGDNDYLQMCLKQYKALGINATGKLVPEAEQPKLIRSLLQETRPDIVVITGHDSLMKQDGKTGGTDYNSLDNYRNSRYFIEAVTEARKLQPSLDELVIIAGACQSYFEGILAAGANFASSPGRILIHALDPVMVSQSIAFTSIDRVAPLEEVLKATMSGISGIGGVQTRGKYRDGMPSSPYISQ